jgi:hypothetical protein
MTPPKNGELPAAWAVVMSRYGNCSVAEAIGWTKARWRNVDSSAAICRSCW